METIPMTTPKKTELRTILRAEEVANFRNMDAGEQLRLLRGTVVERVFQVDRENGVDEEKRTAWLSIASEEPYERWWGIEVLDVRKASIRDARLKAGAPLLVGHDTADQVGVVERHEITPDKRLRVLARFGRSARAEEIWQDVLDGIRRNTSVGYVIHDLVLEKSEEGVNTYRVTDWEPLEGSLVAVPADPTVGVGRAHEPAPAQAPQPLSKEKGTMDKTKEQIDADIKAASEKAVALEQKRVADLLAAGQEYKAHGGVEVAAELAKDPAGSVEKFREKMLAKIATRGAPTTTAEPGGERPAAFGEGARHIIMSGGKLRAFTKPVRFSDHSSIEPLEAAYRAGQWLRAVIGGVESARKWCQANGLNIEQRVMTTESGSAGGYVVPDEMEQAIIDLRASVGVARRLTRRRPMASDTLSVPKRTGGVTAYFVAEDSSGPTASDKSWGQVNLVAKTLAALTKVSKNLAEDSIIDVVDDLAMEMGYAFATKEDQCWLIGDGTSTYGGMNGLLTMFNAGSYASAVIAASGHDTFAEYDNADLSAAMAGVADFPGMNPVWLCSKTFSENVFGRLKRVAGAVDNGVDIRVRLGYGGYEAYTSDIMPKVGTSAVTTTEALFGDFSMSSSFGDRRGIMVEVLRERFADSLQLGVLAHERFHIVNHDLGDANNKGPVAALKGE
jgi:HK97 family phage major capsid protein